MPALKARFWSFTLNNYDDDVIAHMGVSCSSDAVRYCIYGKEVGASGTPHLQGYIAFKKQTTLAQCRKVFNDKAHVEISKGTEDHNVKYCSKGDQPSDEWSSLGVDGPSYGLNADITEFGSRCRDSGKRGDLEPFKDAVKGGNFNRKNLREEFSDVFAKFPRFFDSYIQDNIPTPSVQPHPLREWQQDLNHHLLLPANRRTVIFVIDEKGNNGKTWFAQYFCELHDNAFVMEPAKKTDMAYLLPDICRVLFMDCTREQNEYLNYSFIESCKNGYVVSSKYECRVKRYPPMHVVVFMNQMPDMKKLSEDRYSLINLTT
jgi:Putative viral replication protein